MDKEVLPGGDDLPAGQLEHSVDPRVVEYRPAEQFKHGDPAVAEYLPAGTVLTGR